MLFKHFRFVARPIHNPPSLRSSAIDQVLKIIGQFDYGHFVKPGDVLQLLVKKRPFVDTVNENASENRIGRCRMKQPSPLSLEVEINRPFNLCSRNRVIRPGQVEFLSLVAELNVLELQGVRVLSDCADDFR